MTEIAPNLTRYGDVEEANFFSLAKGLLKVCSIFFLFLIRQCIVILNISISYCIIAQCALGRRHFHIF